MPIYMNWGSSNPPKLRGSVTVTGHQGWIELDAASFGPGARAGSSAMGLAPKEIVITKRLDSASTSFFRMASGGTGSGPTPVTIDFVKIGDKGEPVVTMSWNLTGVVIAGYQSGSSAIGERNAGENVTLNFTKIAWGQVSGVTPHSTDPPKEMGWDVSANRKL